MNTVELPQYAEVVEELAPLMRDLPRRVVAIDGRPGSGKTTLGRYLAWKFNVTLLETDMFRISGLGKPVYRRRTISRLIKHRLEGEAARPVIIEGVAVLRLLATLKLRPDYVIYVSSVGDNDELGSLETEVRAYEDDFEPRKRADHVIDLDHHGI